MIRDLTSYYLKKWYILAAVFIIVTGAMYCYQSYFFNWDRAIAVKHIVIDIACGILAAVFAVFALFVWIDGRKRR